MQTIPGFEGEYQATEDGRVWGVRSHRFLKPRVNTRGYLQLKLFSNGRVLSFRVHRLIALTFLGPVPTGCEVNHKDHNKLNNEVGNLEYVTRVENQHAYQKHRTPGWAPRVKTGPQGPRPRPIIATPIVVGDPVQFTSVQEAVAAGFSNSGISMSISGKIKAHRGYRFERVGY